MQQAIGKEGDSLFKDWFGKTVLGRENFVEKIRDLLRGREMGGEITERKRLRKYPAPVAILTAVASVLESSEKTITLRGGGYHQARNMAIYLIKRYSGLNNQAVGDLFGGVHYSAISQASRRFEKKLAGDQGLRNQLREVLSKVKT